MALRLLRFQCLANMANSCKPTTLLLLNLLMVLLHQVALEMISSLAPISLTLYSEDLGMIFFLVLRPLPELRIHSTEETVMTCSTMNLEKQRCSAAQAMT